MNYALWFVAIIAILSSIVLEMTTNRDSNQRNAEQNDDSTVQSDTGSTSACLSCLVRGATENIGESYFSYKVYFLLLIIIFTIGLLVYLMTIPNVKAFFGENKLFEIVGGTAAVIAILTC